MKHHLLFVLISFLLFLPGYSQPQFSIATDISFLRNLKKEQRFWSIGQTVHGHFHFSVKDGAYAMFSYYTPGKFRNNLEATAKSPATTPREINFISKSEMRLSHLSIGWKRYIKGGYNTDVLNIYGFAGFGMILGKVTNTYDRIIDTSMYIVPANPVNGSGKFKRLTLDIAAGYEIPMSMDIYFYTEGRLWIPTSDYPSRYLFTNDNAPLVATIHAGIRILF